MNLLKPNCFPHIEILDIEQYYDGVNSENIIIKYKNKYNQLHNNN